MLSENVIAALSADIADLRAHEQRVRSIVAAACFECPLYNEPIEAHCWWGDDLFCEVYYIWNALCEVDEILAP